MNKEELKRKKEGLQIDINTLERSIAHWTSDDTKDVEHAVKSIVEHKKSILEEKKLALIGANVSLEKERDNG